MIGVLAKFNRNSLTTPIGFFSLAFRPKTGSIPLKTAETYDKNTEVVNYLFLMVDNYTYIKLFIFILAELTAENGTHSFIRLLTGQPVKKHESFARKVRNEKTSKFLSHADFQFPGMKFRTSSLNHVHKSRPGLGTAPCAPPVLTHQNTRTSP